MLALIVLAGLARADCEAEIAAGPPLGYDDQAQQDFLLSYFALATTLSPLHGPIPVGRGHGLVGMELAGVPPLSCRRRLVLGATKAEETNRLPVVARPHVLFALPVQGRVTPWAGLAYVPPITVAGTRSVLVSVEAGAGMPVGERLQIGLRGHATLGKTVAEIATPVSPDDPVYEDFYVGSTFGAEATAGLALGDVTPYVAAGVTDVSTFFYVGDDGAVVNNTSPFAGPVLALGVQGRIGRIDLAGEAYAAFGYLYTGRARVSLRL